MRNFYSVLFPVFLTFLSGVALAQVELSSAELHRRAQLATYVRKDYTEALRLIRQAIQKEPGQVQMRVLLGRIYILTDSLDQARKELDQVLEKTPGDREALNSYIGLEYKAKDPDEALTYINKALTFFPDDEGLMLRKAQALYDLKEYPEAFSLINDIHVRFPRSTVSKELEVRIREQASLRQLTVGYDYFYFDKNYNSALHDTPWHIANIAYGYRTGRGIIIGRVNYANRFGTNGLQLEADAYPRISPTFYSYVNVGYSFNEPIFPRFRGGYSLYANLPQSFEGEVGFRYLKFSTATWIFTSSVGKYYSNYWFNLRTYLVPDNRKVSHSYTLTTRYYFNTADDFVSLGVGSGISPDENRSVLLDRQQQRLNSRKVDVWYSRRFQKVNVLQLTATWFNEDLSRGSRGSQLSAGFTYQRRF
ncbi:YaiO family outer membrane beta-barrel protein [Telluribacter sp. SYSU D00476]|uniref:YaiO family outer membrane beta-barrel protein n=1 Tax=Telluribacter sp. SYSU D00476 TaxID=2811430 RepID=UPI001FF37227|nr:YaiO family outer membrane beta-barrel protein [Telluribacter sp. SYSU D00476]